MNALHVRPQRRSPSIALSDSGSAAGRSDRARIRRLRKSFLRDNAKRIQFLIILGAIGGLLFARRIIIIAGPAIGYLRAAVLAVLAAALAFTVMTWVRMNRYGLTEPARIGNRVRAQRVTARHLKRLTRRGCVVLHDRHVPRFGVHVDHLVIGSVMVYLVQDVMVERRRQSPGPAERLAMTADVAAAAATCAMDADRLSEFTGIVCVTPVCIVYGPRRAVVDADRVNRAAVLRASGLRSLTVGVVETQREWVRDTAILIRRMCPPA